MGIVFIIGCRGYSVAAVAKGRVESMQVAVVVATQGIRSLALGPHKVAIQREANRLCTMGIVEENNVQTVTNIAELDDTAILNRLEMCVGVRIVQIKVNRRNRRSIN